MEIVDAGPHDLTYIKLGQILTQVCLGHGKHVEQRTVDVGDTPVVVRNHHISRDVVQGIANAQVLVSNLTLSRFPGLDFGLQRQFLRAVLPLHNRTQTLAVIADHRTGDQTKGASAQLDIGLKGRFQPFQHPSLVVRILVEGVDGLPIEVFHPKLGKFVLYIRFRGHQHLANRFIHVNDAAIVVSDHHIGGHIVQRIPDAQVIGRRRLLTLCVAMDVIEHLVDAGAELTHQATGRIDFDALRQIL